MIPALSGKTKAVKKLSRKLHPANIQQLLYIMDADTNGRGSEEIKEPTGAKDIKDIASQITVVTKQYEYLLMGRHLILEGLKPSSQFSIILKESYDAQENGLFNDVEGAIKWLKEYLINKENEIEYTPSELLNKSTNKSKYFLVYLSSLILICIIAITVSIISLRLIYSLWFSIPMTFLSLKIFGNPILDYVKQKYK